MRGHKRAVWVLELYQTLREDFERMLSAGVKFTMGILLQHARELMNNSDSTTSYHISFEQNGRSILDALTRRCMQQFLASNRIVLRVQSGKLMISPSNQEWIENSVSFHMGVLKRGFECGELNEECVENADVTHFLFNMDNGRTIFYW